MENQNNKTTFNRINLLVFYFILITFLIIMPIILKTIAFRGDIFFDFVRYITPCIFMVLPLISSLPVLEFISVNYKSRINLVAIYKKNKIQTLLFSISFLLILISDIILIIKKEEYLVFSSIYLVSLIFLFVHLTISMFFFENYEQESIVIKSSWTNWYLIILSFITIFSVLAILFLGPALLISLIAITAVYVLRIFKGKTKSKPESKFDNKDDRRKSMLVLKTLHNVVFLSYTVCISLFFIWISFDKIIIFFEEYYGYAIILFQGVFTALLMIIYLIVFIQLSIKRKTTPVVV